MSRPEMFPLSTLDRISEEYVPETLRLYHVLMIARQYLAARAQKSEREFRTVRA